ncbi:hypothetical protein ACO1O0_003560 [Amphichorda felina]
MPMPLPEDMWTGTAKLPADIRQKYLPRPQDCETLSPIHLANLKLSVILAKIIRVFNSRFEASHEARILQIYLLLSVASNSLHQRHAFLQFELYTLALREMIPSAWAAHMTIDFFRNAVKKLAARHGQAGGGHHDHRLSGSEQLLPGDSIASPADVRFSATTRQSGSLP